MRKRAPVIAIAIIGFTAVITGLQFAFPEVLTAFRGNREALLTGEWWRIVTPLFVQAYGWWHACVNGVAALVLCPLVERLYGKRLLILYFVSGVLGEIFAYFWEPNGAGSSLGIAGVMGGLFAYVFLQRQVLSSSSRLFAICGIAGAVVLCFARDIHGPPILLGVLLASILTTFRPGPIKDWKAPA
jgi:membrane associated rhomboid family serine protease